MKSFTPIGMVGIDDEGQFRWIPIQLMVNQSPAPLTGSKKPAEELGRIVKPPTPKEVEIAEEKAPDLSVDGILGKRKAEEEPQ